MPYNSSAFEKQLAEFKKKQAGTVDVTEDVHVAKSRVTIGRGEVITNSQTDAEPAESPSQKQPEKEPVTVIINGEKKPFYKQAWFLFLLFSAVTTAAIPLTYNNQLDGLMSMASSIHSDGMDLLTKNEAPAPATPAPSTATNQQQTQSPLAKLKPSLQNAVETIKSKQQAPVPQSAGDIHGMVDQAMQRAAEITSQGPEQSMQYIQNETERLNAIAKEFDLKNGQE